MIVSCVLCDKKVKLDANSFEGKRLINHPLATYMCEECKERIAQKTEKRRREGKLRPSLYHKENDGWS
ncbi:Protein of unknown function DUF2197 [Caldalkalibacillus thermarum TA2.A1]|uniref:YlaI family protein n=1 Tax=Caldalkalibacillus thermarum (strain TA2.A1) TaxID=986075 RepID=F5L859_CALTT|nr:DUF2197 domain-containing protein [Caldalkalibacillus thermarum]EGL82472.1 Protein of unknown function DUF2197 [Caldalkalibacillus thermarum TA2.A1]QZT33179.1 YlaI family protein [Caldalkalibacillus thermarum TA2.A1]